MPDLLDGIDLHAGLRNLNNNRKLYRKILGDVYDRFRDVVFRFETALENQAQDEARRLIHTFKGVAGTIGAGEVQRLSSAIEQVLIDQELERLPSLLPSWSREVERVMQGLSGLQSPAVPVRGEATAGSVSLDRERLPEVFRQLALLIDEGDSDAQERAATAMELLTGSPFVPAMERLIAQIDDYEFEPAKETLSALRHAVEACLAG